MKYKLNGDKLLENIIEAGTNGVHAIGCGLSFLGLQYINENFFGNSIPIPPTSDTSLFSPEFGFYATQTVCFFGAGIKGIQFAYNTMKIPLKLVSGKYFKRNYSIKKK